MTALTLLLASYVLSRVDERFGFRSVWLDVPILASLFSGWFLLWFNFGTWGSR